MAIITDEKRIDEVLSVGAEEVIEKDHLIETMKSGRQLRVKFGIDPTMPDLHLGHSVPLRKLRQFQDLGHLAVLIIGDATAMVGDPSGRSETRKVLSKETVKENMENYLKQAEKILDKKNTEVKYNSEWLDNNMMTILELSKAGTMQQILRRADFKKRLDNDQDITLLEMLYPLLQGYDSVAVKADLEIGGTDQKFNLLAGRRVQRHYNIPEQDILTIPLLEGTDGVKKMSKSYGNYIGLDDKPNDMFGKIMSIPDTLIIKYMSLCSDIQASKIEEMRISMESNILNPRDAKIKLAMNIISLYHSEKEATEAEQNFINTFQKGEIPEEMTEIKREEGDSLMILLVKNGIVSSNGDFRRLIEEGAITNLETDEKITDTGYIPESGTRFRVGKKRFVKIV